MRVIYKSVNSNARIENRNTLSKPISAGSSGVGAQILAASTSTKSGAANLSTQVKRNPQSLQKEMQTLRGDRVPKGANDPFAHLNIFGALEDMDFGHIRPPHSSRYISH